MIVVIITKRIDVVVIFKIDVAVIFIIDVAVNFDNILISNNIVAVICINILIATLTRTSSNFLKSLKKIHLHHLHLHLHLYQCSLIATLTRISSNFLLLVFTCCSATGPKVADTMASCSKLKTLTSEDHKTLLNLPIAPGRLRPPAQLQPPGGSQDPESSWTLPSFQSLKNNHIVRTSQGRDTIFLYL